MFPVSHVRPVRSHMSVAGVTVIVKSCLGCCWSGSLKTLLSMPMFVSASVGDIENGPMRTLACASGSGVVSWAKARGAATPANKRQKTIDL